MSYLEIELFQLENLMHSRTPFTFLDLRETDSESLPAPISAAIRSAAKVAADAVEKHLGSVDKSRPVVLLCADGQTSERTADQLARHGFVNVYVVAGGVAGLRSELD